MVVRGRAHLHYNKLSLSVLIAVILYNEYFAYFSSSLGWPNIPKGSSFQKTILLVADPQIQGNMDEPPFLLGTITRWDSDRYLSKSFSWATNEYQADAVIFLGDLIDEGSRTTDRDTYLEFHSIYPSGSAPLMVYVSGDNDIGGEGDPVTREKVDKFAEFFNPKTMYSFRDQTKLDIVALNMLIQNAKDVLEVDVKEDNTFRLAISHMPLVPPFKQDYTRAVLSHVRPDIVFSAHYHRGMDVPCNRTNGKVSRNVTFFDQYTDRPIKLNIYQDRKDNILHEINVPTCSYRMGVKQMALGLATLNLDSGDFTYYNLWLPSRFSCLLLYMVASFLSLCFVCVGRVFRRRRVGRSAAISFFQH